MSRPSEQELAARPVWQWSASAWIYRQGIAQPHICEISPYQMGQMSKRQRAQYQARRSVEWDKAGQAKAEYRRQVCAAFEAGEFEPLDPKLDRDAKSAILSARAAKSKADAEDRFSAASVTNILGIEDLSIGDRVFVLMGGHYGKVIKINRKSIRVLLDGWPDSPSLISMSGRCGSVRKLSHNDLKASLE